MVKQKKAFRTSKSLEFIHKTIFLTPLMSLDHKYEQCISLEHDPGRKLNHMMLMNMMYFGYLH
jgi:hypothetical protein